MAHSLPLEVQQRIFHFAITRPSRTSILERNRTLCRVAVVSKIWCRLARAELVAHLDVKHPGKPLLNRLAAPKDQITPDALDADQVRSIVFRRAGETAGEKMAEVERLLELCKNVDEIWLESASKAGGRDIRMLNRVKDLPNLRTLHLQRIVFVINEQHILRNVRTLSIRAGGGGSWALLHPRYLPQITTLHLLLETLENEDEGYLSGHLNDFRSLKPQLECLSISSDEEPALAGRLNLLLDGAIHLKHFYLNTKAAVDLESAIMGLSALETLLETFQISFAVAPLSIFALSLMTSGKGLGLRSLKRLIVPGGDSVKGWEGWNEPQNVPRRTVEMWCEERETQLVVKHGYESAESWRV